MENTIYNRNELLKHPVVPFQSKIHPKRPELAFEKNSKTPSLSTVKMDGISLGRYRRSMNLSSFLLPGLKAERCDFLVENRSGASAVQKTNFWFHLCPSIKRNCKRTSELKILQSRSKYHFWGKGRQFTEAKVTQRLFSFDTCTYLAIYATDWANGKSTESSTDLLP